MATKKQKIKNIRATGSEELGYEGDRLTAYIQEEIKEWRAAKEMETARIAAEKAEQNKKELELAKIAADRELAKIAADRERELAQIAAEKEKQIELARLTHALEMEKVSVSQG